MAQSELIKQNNDKPLSMVRDAADLAGRGVNAARVLAFQAQTLAFATLPTDGELDAAKQEATARKTSVQTQAVTQMQVILGIVGTVNDVRSATYKMFGSSGVDSAFDADLYVGLLRVGRVGRARQKDYVKAGLTLTLLDTLAASTTEFLTRMSEQQDAESDRGHAADGRMLTANTLYTELIAPCAVGKALFATTDARKFEDYVVTDTPVPAVVPVPAKA